MIISPKEILELIYNPDKILTKCMLKQTDTCYKITYKLSPSDKSKNHFPHVPAPQITEAILEGFYCLMASILKINALETTLDYSSFLKNLQHATIYQQTLIYREKIEPNSIADLTLSIAEIEEFTTTPKYYSIKMGIRGFTSGQITVILVPQPN